MATSTPYNGYRYYGGGAGPLSDGWVPLFDFTIPAPPVIPPVPDEVFIGPSAPTDAATELWYDTDEPDVPVTYPAWLPLSFQTGWQNYGSTFHAGTYRKVGDIVYLRGLIYQTSGATNIVFNLPAGYRPPMQILQSCHTAVGQARYDIYPNGNLTTGVTLAVGNWVCMDGISFSVTA